MQTHTLYYKTWGNLMHFWTTFVKTTIFYIFLQLYHVFEHKFIFSCCTTLKKKVISQSDGITKQKKSKWIMFT